MLLFFYPCNAGAQNCDTLSTLPFQSGERVEYSLVYQWGLLWLPAGNATFTVEDTLIHGQSQLRLKGYGKSLDSWSWFYEVSSTYASVADSNLVPCEFTRKGQEGSYTYDRKYEIASPDSAHFYRADPSKESRDWSIDLKDQCAHDVVTAVYYMRSLNYGALSPGDTIPLNLILDGSVYPTYARYEGRKLWKDQRTGKKYRTHLIKPRLIEGTVFKSGEGMEVYVSDDNRRIPLYIETNLVVGKARIYLTGAKGLLPKEE